MGYLDMARDLEMRAAIGDLAAGGVGAGLAGGDVAALRDVHLRFSVSSCSPNLRTPNKNQCNVFLAKSRPSGSRLYKFLVS